MLREGQGEPLVLLHGITCTENVWEEVIPHLAPHYDTIALTTLGHRGGPVAARRPVRIEHMVDDVALQLDQLGIEKPHLAGNSMGGWIALELARRGRARSVCALSPAGTWDPGSAEGEDTRQELRAMARDAKRARSLLPLALRFKRVRSYAMALNAAHGERMTPAQILDRTDDVLGCSAMEDVLNTDEALAPIDPLPCPITLAWSEHDRVLPLARNGEKARELVPQARFLVLEGIGHVAMFDDPKLVADTIREACR
jgi:pimeloyl-ACP methyl ester carboxylesterase